MGSAIHTKRETMKLTGWAVFSSVVLLVLGGLNLINGFTTLEHTSYYTSHLSTPP